MDLPAKFQSFFSRLIVYLEREDLPFLAYVFSAFFAVNLRNFMEFCSSASGLVFPEMLHVTWFYVAILLAYVLLLYILIRQSVVKVAKVVLAISMVVLIPPVFNFAFGSTHKYQMTYFFPEFHQGLFYRFLTFGGELENIGISLGQRLEIWLVMFAGYFYARHFRKSVFFSLFFSALLYFVFFGFALLPFYLLGLSKLTGIAFYQSWTIQTVSAFTYITLSILIGITLVIISENPIKKLFSELPIYRVLHYELMIVLGIVLGLCQTSFTVSGKNFFYFIFTPTSLFCALIFSMITNNIQDFEIDKISNPTRLLVSGKITLGHYKALQLPFLVMALFLSSMVGFQTFCLVLLFIGNYYLYSAPPIRFKRVPFFSKFVVAVNSLLAALCGYELIFKSLLGFPPLIVWFLILVLVFPIQFIDIKDYAGDKVVGIRTLPTLLGLPRAKRIIGGFFVAAYTLGAMIFPFGIVTVVVVGAGFLQYYWITRETYQEARVFQTYLLTLLGVILYIGYFGSDLIWR